MTPPEIPVHAAVDTVEAAIAARKIPLLEAAYRDLASAPKSALAEHSAQIAPRLAGLLSEIRAA